MVLVGLKSNNEEPTVYKIEYDDDPYGPALTEIQNRITDADVLVGFNLKHDIHWLRRYGITFDNVTVWDVQLAYFAMCGQTKPYPSLNQVSADYGHGSKIDVIATEYWEKGIDSTEIPLDIFTAYLKQDLNLPYLCYLTQQERLKDQPKLRTCIRLINQDMLVLEEMEFNGIDVDTTACLAASKECDERIREIDSKLNSLISFERINWGSNQHLSSVLYGGSVSYIVREPVKSILKSGKESWRDKNVEYNHSFPRLVEPLKGTELATKKHWSVGSDVLRELKAKGKAAAIINLILERHDIAKLNNTYYKGVPKLMKEMEWEGDRIHGNLNQCVAITGRLSSTKPNMQNMPPRFDLMFRSRYD